MITVVQHDTYVDGERHYVTFWPDGDIRSYTFKKIPGGEILEAFYPSEKFGEELFEVVVTESASFTSQEMDELSRKIQEDIDSGENDKIALEFMGEAKFLEMKQECAAKIERENRTRIVRKPGC